MLHRTMSLQTVLLWTLCVFGISNTVLCVQQTHQKSALSFEGDKDFVENNVKIKYRLPSALKPLSYNLYLHPDITTGNFSGQEMIKIQVLEETDKIFLHSSKLNIRSVYVTNYEVDDFHLDEVCEFLEIKIKTTLKVGTTINLGVIFEGQMSNKIVGLYNSTYLTPEYEKRKIATSKFQPTYARQAFPCFDEPQMKATFSVTLVRPSSDNYHALSNMNEENSLFLGEYTEVYFASSVPMSTYLTCFIVSDFEFKKANVNATFGENFELRIFSTRHQLEKTNFALKTAVAVTEYYIKNFGVEYPLPKLDMAAIPDFASNAMEHWGLLTYRETALLYDRSFSSTWNKQRTAAVIAHELAHMWFGNLVTMNWWNDLWLNEGFARFMEYKAIHQVYQDWGLPDQFLIHALHGVMNFDSSVASHPIVQEVETPDQINEIFDTISYEKGASIIRMVEDIVGTEKFEEAVTNYLNNFKYKSAVTDDFISEVANTGLNFDVRLMMRTWTEQMGLPVVSVRRTSATTFEFTQKRFFSNINDYSRAYDDSEFNYTWTIPITYFYDSDASVRRKWFNYQDASVSISVPIETKWLKLNRHQLGYYRVNYETSMWQEIINALLTTPEKFDVADRAHLMNDIFSLADANQISYEVAFNMTKYLKQESQFVPWYVAVTKLQTLQNILIYTDSYYEYVQYARGLLNKIYQAVTWVVDEENHLENRLRVSILNAACAFGVPDCLKEASERFKNFLDNSEVKLEPDLREIIYYYGMQHVGQQKEWEQLWQLFINEQDANEKLKLMYGLAGVKVPWLLRRLIDLADNEEHVRRQDYFTCIQNIAANPVGEPIVWEFVRENWEHLVARFTLNDRYMGRMIQTITSRFSTVTKLEEMENFFAKHPDAGAGTVSRQQALETVKFNINWMEANLVQITQWLAEQ